VAVLGDTERPAFVADLLVAEVDLALVAATRALVVQLPLVGEAARAPAAELGELGGKRVAGEPRVRAPCRRARAPVLRDVVPVRRARPDEVGALLDLEGPLVDLELRHERAPVAVSTDDTAVRRQLVVHVRDEVVAVAGACAQAVRNAHHLEAVARALGVADGEQCLGVDAVRDREHIRIRRGARPLARPEARGRMGTGRDREDEDPDQDDSPPAAVVSSRGRRMRGKLNLPCPARSLTRRVGGVLTRARNRWEAIL
jgi:hypothetical protein